MKTWIDVVLLSLSLVDVVTPMSLSLRGRERRNHTIVDDVALNGMTAWVAIAGSTSVPHAGNEECSAQLGKYWTLPQSDIAVRHNLIPGTTVIFEVGGNIGEDLTNYVSRFPAAKIYSFEPVPELFLKLQQTFGTNPNVKVTQVGASSADSTAYFVVEGNHGEGSSHADTSAQGQTITVQLRDVSTLLTEVQQYTGKVPDVVSINCEGCEYDVLSRMAQTGWLGMVPFVQLSWHVAGGVQNRLGQRCAIERVLWDKYNPSYHALYGWQGWILKTLAPVAATPTGVLHKALACPQHYPVCANSKDCAINGATAPWNKAPSANTDPTGINYNYIGGVDNAGTPCGINYRAEHM